MRMENELLIQRTKGANSCPSSNLASWVLVIKEATLDWSTSSITPAKLRGISSHYTLMDNLMATLPLSLEAGIRRASKKNMNLPGLKLKISLLGL